MVLDNLSVKHKAFGLGTVVSVNGKYITVKFDSSEKVFVYPDAFERFLTLSDGTVSDEIIADIDSSKQAKQRIIDRKDAENRYSMLKGIVIPGKENLNSENEEEESRSSDRDEII
ncbi:MAG: hypothetical protein IJY69_06130 [Clostridia bacterium]|nr:hypothetical protein [Clostridia bacterium]